MYEKKMDRIPARCGVCGEPVPYAFRDGNGKLFTYPQNYMICSENGIAYHYQPPPGKDCWGIHTGYPNFEESRKSTISKPKLSIWRILAG